MARALQLPEGRVLRYLGLRVVQVRARPAPGLRRELLDEIPGIVPSLADLPPGCAFAPRCAHADEACARLQPVLEGVGGGGSVACLHLDRLAGERPRAPLLEGVPA